MRRQLAHPHFAGPQSQRELPTQKAEVEPTEELGRVGIQLHRSQKWHSRHHKLLHTQGITPPLPSLHCSSSFIGPLSPLVPPSTGPLPPPVPSLHRSPPSTGPLPSPIPSLHRSPPFTGPFPPLVPPTTGPLPPLVPSLHHSPLSQMLPLATGPCGKPELLNSRVSLHCPFPEWSKQTRQSWTTGGRPVGCSWEGQRPDGQTLQPAKSI